MENLSKKIHRETEFNRHKANFENFQLLTMIFSEHFLSVEIFF